MGYVRGLSGCVIKMIKEPVANKDTHTAYMKVLTTKKRWIMDIMNNVKSIDNEFIKSADKLSAEAVLTQYGVV